MECKSSESDCMTISKGTVESVAGCYELHPFLTL